MGEVHLARDLLLGRLVAIKLLTAPAPDGESGGAGPAVVHASALMGTLPYMSPEQMNAGAIDHRSDLWTVGIMLFELVTGEHPVLDATMSTAALLGMADLDKPMPSVRERLPDLGPLAGVIDRCLIKDPAHRTPSARALLDELEALAPGRRSLPVGEDGNPFAGLAAFGGRRSAPTAGASRPRRGTRRCDCGTRMEAASRWCCAATTAG